MTSVIGRLNPLSFYRVVSAFAAKYGPSSVTYTVRIPSRLKTFLSAWIVNSEFGEAVKKTSGHWEKESMTSAWYLLRNGPRYFVLILWQASEDTGHRVHFEGWLFELWHFSQLFGVYVNLPRTSFPQHQYTHYKFLRRDLYDKWNLRLHDQ